MQNIHLGNKRVITSAKPITTLTVQMRNTPPHSLLDMIGKLVLAQIHKKFISGGDSVFRWPAIDEYRPGHLRRSKAPLLGTVYQYSFRYAVKGQTTLLYTSFRFHRVHQEGRVIRAKRSPVLFVPLKEFKTIGGQRFLVEPLKNIEDRFILIRDLNGKYKKVKKFVLGEDFVLPKQVTISPRPTVNFAPEDVKEIKALVSSCDVLIDKMKGKSNG